MQRKRRAGEELTARIEGLAERAARIEAAPDEHRRHAELVESAVERGVDREVAERAYALAEEEDLHPAYALEVVVHGLGIRDLAEPEADVPTADTDEPDWLDTPPTPQEAQEERRLRDTFRRLRGLLESTGSAPDAARELGRQQDIEVWNYR